MVGLERPDDDDDGGDILMIMLMMMMMKKMLLMTLLPTQMVGLERPDGSMVMVVTNKHTVTNIPYHIFLSDHEG